MHIDVSSMVRPQSVAVIGASAKRMTQGNIVISNLKEWGYSGQVLPVHPEASEVDGLQAYRDVAALPAGTDTAIVAIPAAHVSGMLQQLENTSVRSAIVYSNGFSPEDERAIKGFGRSSRLIVHGPNCMGLVNFTDSIPLYPSRPSKRLRPGRIALVAQSGSAAISVMNSTVVGLSKVVTMGSEFQVAAADYLHWLAKDEATSAIGVVAESIKDPVALAYAAEAVHAAGKALVFLKVGRTASGVAATQAHTGALVSDTDAYDDFFASTDIATVSDYDELIASLEAASGGRRITSGRGIGIVGISGGQTALACDIAETIGLGVAEFGDNTRSALEKALPGASTRNPVDFGATVNAQDRQPDVAINAVLADDEVGAVVALQDTQESLNPATLQNYMNILGVYAETGKAAQKPFLVLSPTSESLDPGVRSMLAENGIPLLRGLRQGLVAIGNLARNRPGHAGKWAAMRDEDRAWHNAEAPAWRSELARRGGPLDAQTATRLLRAYGLPLVKSFVVADMGEAIRRAPEIGYPMVVKVASRQVQHRSDAGGVLTDIADATALEKALQAIRANVTKHVPGAVIDGFEMQEQVGESIEALAGFTAAEPFGALMVAGSGGTMVEVLADRAARIAPLDADAAAAMIAGTKLSKSLDGYRNLTPLTARDGLIDVLVRLSRLAHDMRGVLAACDLNPVMVRHGTGEVRIVDALLVARAANDGEG